MAGVSAPAIMGSLPGYRVAGAAREVLSDLRLARAMALNKGVDAVVDFNDTSAKKYFIYLDSDANGVYSSGSDELVKEVDLDDSFDNIVFQSNDASAPSDGVDLDGSGGNAVTFIPRGSASGTGAIYLMPGGNTGKPSRNKRIKVFAGTGSARVEQWDGSVWE